MKLEVDNYNALHDALNQMCHLFADLPQESLFDCKLVAMELMSNVLQHGGKRAYFQAEKNAEGIVICVRSEIAYRPPEESVCADAFMECGRGLYLVDSLCLKREYNEREGIRVTMKIK